jgi:hypothetical protein
MARTSSRNTQTRSSGVGSRGGNSNVNLTADQEVAVKELKEELTFYQERLKEVKRKRRKIKEILDNLENIILGDVIIDVLPDENSEEIINSLIIPKVDITKKLSGVDTSEIFEEVTTTSYDSFTYQTTTSTTLVGTGRTVSGYTTADINKANTLLNKVFEQNVSKELISFSTELNNNELYLPVYLQLINDISSSSEAKEILREVLSEIENDLL